MWVPRAVGGKGIERRGGPVRTCVVGSTKAIHLGLLLLLAIKIRELGLHVDIVIHIVTGILRTER